MISLSWKLKLPPGQFGPLMPFNSEAKKRINVLAGVIDSDYQGEIELLLHNGGETAKVAHPSGIKVWSNYQRTTTH